MVVAMSGYIWILLKNITFAARDTMRVMRCGNSSVGRASASQAEGREFEPRLPLKVYIHRLDGVTSVTLSVFKWPTATKDLQKGVSHKKGLSIEGFA